MFYLFSSDFEPRFKRNILDILCYPEKHIFRFRYHANHVGPEIKTWSDKGELPKKLKELKGKGLCVYAESTGEAPNNAFNFYALREVEIIRIQLMGNVYYIDMRLGYFVDYFTEGQRKAREQLEKFQEGIKTITFYPLPQLSKNTETGERQGWTWSDDGKLEQYNGAPGFTNQGYFFLHVPDASGRSVYAVGQSGNYKAWESVAEVLSSAPSMQSAVFYLVEGFFRVRKTLGWLGEYKEYFIKPRDDEWDTRYPIKMGTSVVLKLLFFRSSKAPRINDRLLDIKTDSDAFAGFSQKEIRIESRYNEERILIASKRVFDSIFAPIMIGLKEAIPDDQTSTDSVLRLAPSQVATPWGLIELKLKDTPVEGPVAEEDVLAAESFLLTQIKASRLLIFATLIFLALASFFLFMSPDYIQSVGWSRLVQGWSKPFGDLLVRNAPVYAQVSKIIGFVFTLAAGYLGFRKLPLGR